MSYFPKTKKEFALACNIEHDPWLIAVVGNEGDIRDSVDAHCHQHGDDHRKHITFVAPGSDGYVTMLKGVVDNLEMNEHDPDAIKELISKGIGFMTEQDEHYITSKFNHLTSPEQRKQWRNHE